MSLLLIFTPTALSDNLMASLSGGIKYGRYSATISSPGRRMGRAQLAMAVIFSKDKRDGSVHVKLYDSSRISAEMI